MLNVGLHDIALSIVLLGDLLCVDDMITAALMGSGMAGARPVAPSVHVRPTEGRVVFVVLPDVLLRV